MAASDPTKTSEESKSEPQQREVKTELITAVNSSAGDEDVILTEDVARDSLNEQNDDDYPKMKSLEEVMQEFLEEEKFMTATDYMRRFYQIRVEQEKLRSEPEFSCDSACSHLHYARNRYRDILPYDHNRVTIQKGDENPDGYMNASFIQVPGGETKFIAAQAPLPATLDEWWKMIDEHQVYVIVILCKLVEMNKIKCERYWPAEVETSEIFGDYEITLEKEQTFEDDEYLLRVLTMRNLETDGVREIHQLHYREWPDHGCPSGEKQLLNMVEEMVALHERTSATSPILVHCSAGVGRTGTIIAVNHIRERMKAAKLDPVDLYQLVLTLRRQRASMVQTQDQFQFVHKCVATYFRQHLGIPEPEPTPVMHSQSSYSLPVRLIAPPTPTEQFSALGEDSTAHSSNSDVPSCEEANVDADLKPVPEYPDFPPSPTGPEEFETLF
ncbi:unnamed protein product [Caenorhabditis auriculariae]|uniref:protein-tyrosine-phosphatase n=1 Tax=Caenorhabditis auriculariae TaxID=2777116 RepID=A0A8S1H7V2_9PELO|nr:unnamed protein product [Caenorhabditis auriculariae]